MATQAKSSKPWADEPLALIPTPLTSTKKTDMFTRGASHMCMMHNSIFRGYNSIYLQAPHVRDQDKQDFIGYCLTWYKFVSSHAADEEANLFPLAERVLRDEALFAETHKEHDAFLPPLAGFQQYLTSLKAPTDFSGTELRRIMSLFQGPFESHFRSEIATLANLAAHPNAPAPGTPEEKRADAEFERWGQSSVTKAGITDVTLFFLFNLDSGYEDGRWARWPDIPAPIKWGLMNVGSKLHSRWWKFASCDAGGRPRELYALAS